MSPNQRLQGLLKQIQGLPNPWPEYWRLVTTLLAAGMLLATANAEAACTLRDSLTVESLVLPVRQDIRHDNYHYFAQLLQLALEKTEDQYGPCKVSRGQAPKPEARLYRDLYHQDGVHILDANSTPERNHRFLAVRVPLLKGLMGYRVAFIREEDQQAFARIRNLEDLSQFRAGQGEGWPDVAILRGGGVPVTTTERYEALFRMLQRGRFDFFPRGAIQLLMEKDKFNTRGLVIEQSLVLVYPMPVYFYVNRANRMLANRVAQGLHLAIEDGSFDRFFHEHRLIRKVFEQLDLNQRRPLYLCNPAYNDPVMLSRDRLWIKPWPDGLCMP